MMQRTIAGLAVCGGLLAACATGPGRGTETTAAVTTPPAPTTSSPTVPTTTSAPTTTLPVTTGIMLPPDLGRLVPSAPGVSTPGDIWQLAPKLWLFLPSEPAGDPNLTPPKPEDAEILIAYARKQKALNLAASSYPMTLGSADVRATYTEQGAEGRIAALEPWADAYLEFDQGVVFRPRVLSEPRSSTAAVVFDCYFDHSYFADPRSGQPFPDERTGHRTSAVFAELVRVEGKWLVDLDGPEDLACA